ncbi:MAG: phosphatidylglycerol lysyltransferase domain-containing protein [Oscillospiraceae bacterium]
MISDKDWINSILRESDYMGCEYSFANNMAWRRLSNTKICRYKNFYISCSFENDKPFFNFPAGNGDYCELFSELKKISDSYNVPLEICSITPQKLLEINELFPDEFAVSVDEDSFDYIYLAQDLINLNGKKYHQKRNHLSKFYANNWVYEDIKPENFDECIEFSAISYNDKKSYTDVSSVAEQFAINTYFNYYNEFDLSGGILRIDGEIVAFTIGEKINSNTFCVHIEKALPNIQGAYTAINKEFLSHTALNCKYINREEDLGIEGLRKAKRSYYPCFQLEKSTIAFR